MDLNTISNTDIKEIEAKLNNKSRKRYQHQNPIFVMNQLLFNHEVVFMS